MLHGTQFLQPLSRKFLHAAGRPADVVCLLGMFFWLRLHGFTAFCSVAGIDNGGYQNRWKWRGSEGGG